jgi:GcrA cell cycle regulator
MTWGEKEDGALRAGVLGGKSAKDVADEMGISRNAVLGRAWRLGLNFSGERKPRGKTRQLAVNGVRRPRVPKVKLAPRVPTPAAVAALETFTAPPEPQQPVGVTLMDLEEGMCKWPVGDLFCGCKAMRGKPYCPQHTYLSKLTRPMAATPAEEYNGPRMRMRMGW